MHFMLPILLILLIAGSFNVTPPAAVTFIEPDRIYEISFQEKPGRATIVYNTSRGVDISVWTRELDPLEEYEIAIVCDDGAGGVTFGPAENLQFKMGELEGDTILRPNPNGELHVSMLNPERIFTEAEQVIIEVRSRDRNVILESESFRF